MNIVIPTDSGTRAAIEPDRERDGVWVTWLNFPDGVRPRFFFGRRELETRQNDSDLSWMTEALHILDTYS